MAMLNILFKDLFIAGLSCVMATTASAEREACPKGKTGDWLWQVEANTIKMTNPDMNLAWDTVDEDVVSKAFTVTASLKDTDKLRLVRFSVLPLAFRVTQTFEDREDLKVVMFAERPEGVPSMYGEYMGAQHKYVGLGADLSKEPALQVFTTRVHDWERDDYKLSVSWSDTDQVIDWSFADITQFRLMLMTTYFNIYGQTPRWDLVAQTEPIDLTQLKPLLAELRPIQEGLWKDNVMCDWDYDFPE